jgi:penicillin amidase/acyl-homoserine-lactone acylase
MKNTLNLLKRLGLVLMICLCGAILYVFAPVRIDLSELANLGEMYQVEILRDRWGVPHIFGQTDADAAYGLAYAHAEDDFLTIQQTLLAARGQLASVYGKDAAANDYMVQLLRIWDVVAEAYERDLTSDTQAIMEAYANGVNVYAALHPEEVLTAELFPVDGRDLAAASIHKSPLFFGLDDTLAELFQDSRQRDLSPSPTSGIFQVDERFGSNTFSISPNRSEDGSTYLAVNSHQPWEGPTTWYEAHVHSETGWDMTGATFPATPVIIHGANRNLGWAFTVNHPDLTDVYLLETDYYLPKNYKFDDEWLSLEEREAPIRVKLFGRLTWTVKEKVYWSVYGPVVRQKHGTYALRYAGYGRADIFQQLYRMNKAATFEDWRAALRDGGLPSFNVGYADRDGNIFYVYNALLPVRNEGYDWSLYLPGNTSETLWTETLPFDDLPQVFNPPSGFIQNANSSPFQTTLDPWNPDPDQFSETLGIETKMTNRALRALELFGTDPSIGFEEFIGYKFDNSYSTASDPPHFIKHLAQLKLTDDSDLQHARDLLTSWDLRMTPDSYAATIWMYTLDRMLENDLPIRASALVDTLIPDKALAKAFTEAVEMIRQKYGRIEVPWSEANRLIRGSLDLGLDGGPDVLRAVYGEVQGDGRFKGYTGDSYVLLAKWGPDKSLQAYSIHQYGSATLDSESIHFSDQSALFAAHQLKPAWIDRGAIEANLESIYRPGEEMK